MCNKATGFPLLCDRCLSSIVTTEICGSSTIGDKGSSCIQLSHQFTGHVKKLSSCLSFTICKMERTVLVIGSLASFAHKTYNTTSNNRNYTLILPPVTTHWSLRRNRVVGIILLMSLWACWVPFYPEDGSLLMGRGGEFYIICFPISPVAQSCFYWS